MNFEKIISQHPEIFSVGFYNTDRTWFNVWERCRPDEQYDYTYCAPWERGSLIARGSDEDGYWERPLADFC